MTLSWWICSFCRWLMGDSTIYIELIKQAPYIAALILLVGIFLWTEDRRETKAN